MKKVSLILTFVAIVFAGFLGVVMYSNNAYPGQALYSLDRGVESFQLNLNRMLGKAPYARYNLTLAKERLVEIRDYKSNKGNISFLFKSLAQTPDTNTTDPVVAGLLEDFNFNLKEVINAFGSVKDDQSPQAVELAQEIADSTTEFGTELGDLVTDFSNDEKTQVDDSADLLEDLDDDAVEELVTESENEDENQNEDSIRSTSVDKVTKKILKAGEKLVDLQDSYTDKKKDGKITTAEAAIIDADIVTITTSIGEAKAALATGDLTVAYDKAKSAMDLIAKTKDLFSDEDKNSESSDSTDDNSDDSQDDKVKNPATTKDDKNDDSNDDSNEDSNDDSNDKPKSTTTKPKVEDKDNDSGNDSGSSDDSNDDEPEVPEVEEPEVDDDVKGVSTTTKSDYWLKLMF